MLDVAFGDANTSRAANVLLASLRNMNLNGTLYLGYPILSSMEGRVRVDALLTCLEHGVVAFDLTSNPDAQDGEAEQRLESLHGDLFIGIENKLREYRELRKGRRLAFQIHTVTLLPSDQVFSVSDEIIITSSEHLPSVMADFDPLDQSLLEQVNAAIQTATTIKPKKKRTSVTSPASKGGILKEIERQVANLDRWQKKAVIEFPEGAQRIRGLAGSGKTIVLAQKAALLHAEHPDWTIAVTFNTRSLYQQFRSLIRRFCYEITRDDPDWAKLRIIHAWGSASSPEFTRK